MEANVIGRPVDSVVAPVAVPPEPQGSDTEPEAETQAPPTREDSGKMLDLYA